jgi:DNA replication protein DnaC
MNIEATLSKLNQMKFHGFYRAYKEAIETGIDKNFTSDQFIAHLIDTEWDDRFNRKLKRLVNYAKFRYNVSFEQISFNINRGLDKNLILRLNSCDWLKKSQNIIITGPTGVGKSFIASALGHQACIESFKVIYYNTTKLFQKLKYAKADGSYIKVIDKIARQDLLIIDDFGIKKFDRDQRLFFLEIMEDRHGKKSTIITAQIPVKNWFDVIGEPTIADAILDRLIHSSHRISLQGESLRKKMKNN